MCAWGVGVGVGVDVGVVWCRCVGCRCGCGVDVVWMWCRCGCVVMDKQSIYVSHFLLLQLYVLDQIRVMKEPNAGELGGSQ